jgi:hypothetical protein
MTNQLNLRQNLALLLTATIDIKGMPKAYPTLAEQRQEDYYNSLKYYVTNHPQIQKIVFVENSGYSLDRVLDAVKENPHNKQVEFISLNCNDFPRILGKGYGESLLIDQGIQQSELIKTVTHIAKITGRIYLLNLTKILEKIKKPYDCLCDFKDQGYIIKRLLGENTACPNSDTRFLVFSKALYQQYFQPLHHEHKNGCFYFETKYYHAIINSKKEFKVITRFPIEPNFRGVAGHFGGKDYSSKPEQIKYIIRSFTRKIAPWIHL